MVPGPAFWAIIACAILLLAAGIAGYLTSPTIATLSEMITHNPEVRNLFGFIVGLVLLLQLFYVVLMYKRVKAKCKQFRTPSALFAGVALGFAMMAGGSGGFATVSTDISSETHTVFAAVAFAGLYLYLLTFAAVIHVEKLKVLWPDGAAAFLCVPVLCLIAWLATGRDSSHDYVYEFVFIGSMLAAACCLFMQREEPLQCVFRSSKTVYIVPTADEQPASLVF